MDLDKLYQAQEKIDQDILDHHPEITAEMDNNSTLVNSKLLALNVELGELAQEVQDQWKYWKKHPKKEDKEKVLDEYSDVLHFALSLGNVYGFTVSYCAMFSTGIVDLFNYVFSRVGNFSDYRTERSYTNMMNGIFNLGFELGFSDKEIEAGYFKKNKVNYERQKNNY